MYEVKWDGSLAVSSGRALDQAGENWGNEAGVLKK